MLYLDNAATTHRKPNSVYRAAFKAALISGNAGRGINKLSLESVRIIIKAQEAAAELFGISDECNIVFTQNATYALNMAIYGTLNKGDNIVVTAMDHNSVLRPAVMHGDYSVADADNKGYVSPASVRRRIRDNTKLVACTHVSNVCGAVQPVHEIARAAHMHGAMFLLDCSQSAGGMDVKPDEIGADIIACPGHKGLMGPMGTGILYIKEPERVKAVFAGGTGSESDLLTQPQSMPDKFHCGTMNIPGIAGLCEGIKFIIKEGAENIGAYEKRLSDSFRSRLMNMSGITVYGRGDTGITAFNIDGMPSEEAAERLNGIIVRAGYHCAPLAHKALGTSDGGCIRVSFGYYNKLSDAKRAADVVYNALKI